MSGHTTAPLALDAGEQTALRAFGIIGCALWPIVRRQWRHHPWRHAAAALAVALGVALAWSVHLINASALTEFSAAVRAANGEPDLVLRGPREGLADTVLDLVSSLPAVAQSSAVIEFETYAQAARVAPQPAAPTSDGGPDGFGARRMATRVLALDALAAARITPAVLPQPAAGSAALVLIDPMAVFVNASARERLRLQDGDDLWLQAGARMHALRVSGSVAAGGPPLVVMDIATAQAHFGHAGRITRIDLRLAAGADPKVLRAAVPAGVLAVPPNEAEQRVSNLSRAYRVNLTVLALVALFVGAFLVYSVVALSVAQRTPELALLGVLGLTARERRAAVLAECAALGLAGSVVGLTLGTGLAALALQWMAGDLGGGYFPGIAPALQSEPVGLALFAALGVASAVAGGWVPARRAEQLQPAVALKGLGAALTAAPRAAPALVALAAGVLLALAPPVAGLPVAAYISVALLLVGGVALVPAAVHAGLALVPTPSGALSLLALRRAHHARHTATAAVSGVVASLALSVALTVMVSSFRDGVSRWLDQVLPADLYARTAATSALAEQSWLPADATVRAAAVDGVRRIEASRVRPLQLAPGRPAVTLIARDLDDGASALPLLKPALPHRGGEIGVFVSEAVVTLYGAGAGDTLRLPLDGREHAVRVRGVWRDYARQFGAIAIDTAAYRTLTGDDRINDLAIWLAPAADKLAVQAGVREAAGESTPLEFASTDELRRLSLAIFDRSFVVTYYLQAVAIAIGLVGVAASLSAQVLARRKEFGLLSHLGLTRAQVVALVTGEATAWLGAGAGVGLALGGAISVVLVHVVNPQSFHWTMELVWPWLRLLALCAAVVAAGLATAALSARGAASRRAVASVKEDW